MLKRTTGHSLRPPRTIQGTKQSVPPYPKKEVNGNVKTTHSNEINQRKVG
ncbi:6108_t:CDS:2 [Acaulospora morrowiae]|uniref:6108_t:CDS:1 n=1 Tax=Acaulospora morrowiae TaxID=94023 RepID=A0A9N8W8W3_9GLOM|nr:6108_t:CDS:2 [Acaulospora morrowiae]